MTYFKLKKYLPRSFFGRALLIIILPIIILEAIIGFAFIQRYFEQVTTQLAKSSVLQINYVLDRYENTPKDSQAVAVENNSDKGSVTSDEPKPTFACLMNERQGVPKPIRDTQIT